VQQICNDLAAEHGSLDDLVARLASAGWDVATPSPGWAVRDQISHLGYYDRAAVLAITDPDAFQESVVGLLESLRAGDPSIVPGRAMDPVELLAWWREGRDDLLAALRPLDAKQRMAWYGPPMSARSFATARLMETWAHGQDVADALGVEREATDRLRNVAHLGVQARAFSYVVHGRPAPTEAVHVALTSPSGELWEWGDAAVDDHVRGPALDFCLVVTQRRHPRDTTIEAEGSRAEEWLGLAQAFAGPPGPGRPPSRTI
jgi:uncharacterized protein (TIGR03084 family)